ncbi:MAG: PEGA domain-containing protein [Bacteriovorax sp.]|nr:PEGA domain-containing protein [Bacteriovorax sp.]
MKLCLFVIVSLLLASCSSSTVITSTDKDSKIYVDGMFAGTGQATHQDQKIVGSTTTVQIKKDGCEDMSYIFARNEKFDAGACLGGVFLLVPFLWIMEYNPLHNYEYVCTPKK